MLSKDEPTRKESAGQRATGQRITGDVDLDSQKSNKSYDNSQKRTPFSQSSNNVSDSSTSVSYTHLTLPTTPYV